MITHKAGDTLYLPIEAEQKFDGDVPPISDFTGWQVFAQVYEPKSGRVLATLGVDWLDRTRFVFALTQTADATRQWPAGVYAIDVQVTMPNGQTMSTQSAPFKVLKRGTETISGSLNNEFRQQPIQSYPSGFTGVPKGRD